jgi:hypothetical protein
MRALMPPRSVQKKRAVANHTCRATGIRAYLKNRGVLENAAAMANRASTRTTQLYDRRPDEVNPTKWSGFRFDRLRSSET